MCASVSLEVERIVESLAADSAEIPLDITVTFNMAVEKSLQRKYFTTYSTLELAVLCLQT